jgi:hypothetical protein
MSPIVNGVLISDPRRLTMKCDRHLRALGSNQSNLHFRDEQIHATYEKGAREPALIEHEPEALRLTLLSSMSFTERTPSSFALASVAILSAPCQRLRRRRSLVWRSAFQTSSVCTGAIRISLTNFPERDCLSEVGRLAVTRDLTERNSNLLSHA